jgi:hypothetical protein
VGVTAPWAPLAPGEVAELLAGFPGPWWIGGGVAIDLWLGRTTRPHKDVDVVVLRRDQAALRDALPAWDLHVAHEGTLDPWDGRRLELPLSGLWARRNAHGPWELDLLLMETDSDRWLFRRDPSISLPLAQAGDAHVLAPEIVLLYKAKAPREHDEADFAAAAPELPEPRRRWLRDAIAHVHPGNPWLTRL